MTPDQISKLPPELTQFAEKIRGLALKYLHVSTQIEVLRMYERDVEEIVNAALTWCLQVVEERDASWEQLYLCDDIKLDQSMAGCISDLQKDREYQFHRGSEWREQAESQRKRAETAEATIATLTRERDELEKQLSRIAETVAKLPSITGLQTGCVKDHSLIWMAIRDAQDAYRDTLARHQREAKQYAGRAETAEAEVTRLRDELEREQRIIGLSHTPEGRGKWKRQI